MIETFINLNRFTTLLKSSSCAQIANSPTRLITTPHIKLIPLQKLTMWLAQRCRERPWILSQIGWRLLAINSHSDDDKRRSARAAAARGQENANYQSECHKNQTSRKLNFPYEINSTKSSRKKTFYCDCENCCKLKLKRLRQWQQFVFIRIRFESIISYDSYSKILWNGWGRLCKMWGGGS